MSDDEKEPKRTEPCKECSTKSYRHFHIGDAYKFTLCTICRNGDGWDHEINLTYMKKACLHFRRLWKKVCVEERPLSPLLYDQIPRLHTKNDFFRPVARYENYFDLDKIRDHIKDIWKEKINPLFEMYPCLIKYDPGKTFTKCVTWALSKKPLKSAFVKKYTSKGKYWDSHCDVMLWREYYNDFDFCTCDPRIMCRRKAKLYQARESSFASLQALFRGYMVRKKANDQLRMKSAVVIQASWRKKNAMRLLKNHKQCAVKIQALFRGYYVRRPYGIYRSWAFWNLYTAPPQLETIVQNLVSHGAVQRPKKRRRKQKRRGGKKVRNNTENQQTLAHFWHI